MKPYISADIGGSHISTSAIDPETREFIADAGCELKVDNKASSEKIINSWAEALKITIDRAGGLKGIGVAIPGPFDYFNGISKIRGVDKFDSLYDVNIEEALKNALGLDDTVPVRFINDATAFAIGEVWAGKAKNYQRTLAITLGTGFGSAFLERDIPVLEGNRVPELGCVYHLPYKNGIADEYFSTRWFVNSFKERTGEEMPGVKEIADLAFEGRKDALELFETFGRNLGEFLAEWIIRFDAGILVIGGNIANAGDLFLKHLHDELKIRKSDVMIEFSELKEKAALLGAAHLVDDRYYEKIRPLLKLM